MELASLVRDILRQRHVERLRSIVNRIMKRKQSGEIARWRHRSGW